MVMTTTQGRISELVMCQKVCSITLLQPCEPTRPLRPLRGSDGRRWTPSCGGSAGCAFEFPPASWEGFCPNVAIDRDWGLGFTQLNFSLCLYSSSIQMWRGQPSRETNRQRERRLLLSWAKAGNDSEGRNKATRSEGDDLGDSAGRALTIARGGT